VLPGFAPGVEVRAQVPVGCPALEHLVGDLEKGVRDRSDGFLLGDRYLSRRTGGSAGCTGPAAGPDRIAAQTAGPWS
jgi:hypothetical protein